MSFLLEPILDIGRNKLIESLPGGEFASKTAEIANDAIMSTAEKLPIVGPMLKKGAQLFNWGEDEITKILTGTRDEIEEKFGIGSAPKNAVTDKNFHTFNEGKKANFDPDEFMKSLPDKYANVTNEDEALGGARATETLIDHQKDIVNKTVDHLNTKLNKRGLDSSIKGKLNLRNEDGSINMKKFISPIDTKFIDGLDDTISRSEFNKLYEENGGDLSDKEDNKIINRLWKDQSSVKGAKPKLSFQEFKNFLKEQLESRNITKRLKRGNRLTKLLDNEIDHKPIRDFLLGTQDLAGSGAPLPPLALGELEFLKGGERSTEILKGVLDDNPLVSEEKLIDISDNLTDEEINELSEKFKVLDKIDISENGLLRDQFRLNDSELMELSEINPLLKKPIKSLPVDAFEKLKIEESAGSGLEDTPLSEALDSISSPNKILFEGLEDLTDEELKELKLKLKTVKTGNIPFVSDELDQIFKMSVKEESEVLGFDIDKPFEEDEEKLILNRKKISGSFPERIPTPDDTDLTNLKLREIEQFLIDNESIEESSELEFKDEIGESKPFEEVFIKLDEPVKEEILKIKPFDGGLTKFKNSINEIAEKMGVNVKKLYNLIKKNISKIKNDLLGKNPQFVNALNDNPFISIDSETLENEFREIFGDPNDPAFNIGDFIESESSSELIPLEEASNKLNIDPSRLKPIYDNLKVKFNEFKNKFIEGSATIQEKLKDLTPKDILFGVIGGGLALGGIVLSLQDKEAVQKLEGNINKVLDDVGAPKIVKDITKGILKDMEKYGNQQTKQFQDTIRKFMKEQLEFKGLQGNAQRALQIFNQPSTSVITNNENEEKLKQAEQAVEQKGKLLEERLKQIEKQGQLTKTSIDKQKEAERVKKADDETRKRVKEVNDENRIRKVEEKVQKLPRELEGVIRPQLAGDSVKLPVNFNIINRVQSPTNTENAEVVNDGVIQKNKELVDDLEEKKSVTNQRSEPILRERKEPSPFNNGVVRKRAEDQTKTRKFI